MAQTMVTMAQTAVASKCLKYQWFVAIVTIVTIGLVRRCAFRHEVSGRSETALHENDGYDGYDGNNCLICHDFMPVAWLWHRNHRT